MTKYIIKRLLIALPTLIGITIIDYAIMCFAGSPLEMMQGARISQAAWLPRRLRWGWISLLYPVHHVAGPAAPGKHGIFH